MTEASPVSPFSCTDQFWTPVDSAHSRWGHHPTLLQNQFLIPACKYLSFWSEFVSLNTFSHSINSARKRRLYSFSIGKLYSTARHMSWLTSERSHVSGRWVGLCPSGDSPADEFPAAWAARRWGVVEAVTENVTWKAAFLSPATAVAFCFLATNTEHLFFAQASTLEPAMDWNQESEWACAPGCGGCRLLRPSREERCDPDTSFTLLICRRAPRLIPQHSCCEHSHKETQVCGYFSAS